MPCRHPRLLQINTRARLAAWSSNAHHRVTLADWPEADLDEIARLGFDWVWLLGVWQTGPLARAAALREALLLARLREEVPAFTEHDVCASPFAVADYAVHADFGGDAALASFRERLRRRGIALMLDFVPNHTGLDHRWVREHPEFYIQGGPEDLARSPENFLLADTSAGPRVLAHGRDPNFPGWRDTFQINYAHAGARAAVLAELARVAERCDGVRCDMAMLILPEVFERTWGMRPEPFWPAAIERIREARPGFTFMAEVYWDLEWELQQEGFDFTYDKRLYDRLLHGPAASVRAHLAAGIGFQARLARFLENHDEPRAAAAFCPEHHRAAAAVAFLAPGLRFFHDGQLQGRRFRAPMQLARVPREKPDPAIQQFYERLLAWLRESLFHTDDWRLIEPRPVWGGNPTHDQFVAFAWMKEGRPAALVAANLSSADAQCRLPLPTGPESRAWRLEDRLGGPSFTRNAAEMADPGLFVDLPAWGVHAFEMHPTGD